MTLRNAGLSHRTLLIFAWDRPGPTQALRDDVLGEAVEIEGVAKRFIMEEEAKPPKTEAKEKQGTAKKLPKWFSKLNKK